VQVSVIVPVFNGREWIARSVRSALDQTSVSLEVIVVDDASRDGTREILSGLAAADPRVRLIRSGVRLGPAGARNLAMDTARGEWIAFLDADDRYYPQRLAQLLAAAAEHGVDLLGDNQRFVTEDGSRSGLMWPELVRPQRFDAEGWVRSNVWSGPQEFGYGWAKVLVRRSLVESPRLRMQAQLRMMEDFHFVLALLMRGHALLLIPEPLYEYTVRRPSLAHGGSHQDDIVRVLDAGRELLRRLPPGGLRSAMEAQQASVELRDVRQRVLRRLKACDMLGAARLLRQHPQATRLVADSLMQYAKALPRRMHTSLH
jgi:glycosyltransferase involved in cell wall biosynthesis